MPKGRGSNERRRTERQKRAIRMSQRVVDDPVAIHYSAARGRRMRGNRPPKAPATNTWTLKNHPRTDKAQKRTEDNKRRRARNWKGN